MRREQNGARCRECGARWDNAGQASWCCREHKAESYRCHLCNTTWGNRVEAANCCWSAELHLALSLLDSARLAVSDGRERLARRAVDEATGLLEALHVEQEAAA